MSATQQVRKGCRWKEAILPDLPGQQSGWPVVPVRLGGWCGRLTSPSQKDGGGGRRGAGKDFPNKRRCALGLSVGVACLPPPAALARTAKPELDPRDDA
jgi:hypothetical protein